MDTMSEKRDSAKARGERTIEAFTGIAELVGIQDFAEVQRVLATFLARPAVQRGMKVPARPAG